MALKLWQVWVMGLVLMLGAGLARGQEADPGGNGAGVPAVAAGGEVPTLEQVQGRLAEVSERKDLDEATKSAVVKELTAAVRAIEARQKAGLEREQLAQAAESAPRDLEAIREELARPAAEAVASPGEGATGDSVKQSLQQAEAALMSARQKVTELKAEQAKRQSRRQVIPTEIEAERTRLTEARDAIRRLGAPADELGQAKLTALRAEAARAEAQVAMLEAEVRSYDARATLLPARMDRAERRVKEAEAQVAAWQRALREFTDAQLTAERRELERLAQRARGSELADLAQRNEALIAQRAEVVSAYAETSQELSEVQASLDRVHGAFTSSLEKIKAVSLTKDMGLHLRSELKKLPDADQLRRRVESLRENRAQVLYDQILLEEEREGLSDIEGLTTEIVAGADAGTDREERRLESFVREVLTKRAALLDEAIRDFDLYLSRSEALVAELEALIAEVEEYQAYIEERILWVRSVQGSLVPDWRALRDASIWMLTTPAWIDALRLGGMFALESWLGTGVWVLVIGGLVVGRPRVKRELGKTAVCVDRLSTDTIWQTFRALGLIVLLALPGPLLLFALSWALRGPTEQEEIGLAVSGGLTAAGGAWLPLALLKQILHRSGVAPKHFRWPHKAVAWVRWQLRWLTPIVVAASFVWGVMEGQPRDAWKDSLGRVAFIVAAVSMGVFAWRTFRGSSPVQEAIEKGGSTYVSRFRALWYPLTILAPVSMGVLALLGYYYTAVELQTRVWVTVWLVLVLVMCNAVLVRWLVLARRRLLMEENRRRRERTAAATETGEGVAVPEDSRIDVTTIDVRTRHLFRTLLAAVLVGGLFLAWSEVMPALRMLERVQLYPQVRLLAVSELRAEPEASPMEDAADAEASSAEGDESPASVATAVTGGVAEDATAVVSNVSLADVGAMLLIVLLTVLAVRNVPALLEIAVVGHLPVDAGARYAILAVVRYVLMLVGIGLAFGAIGIGWSKVQWLAAALTFGLGFGLQEIFANFVSGLIILAERPIRVGDTVTVQGVSGTVTRLRMRATTITDWDLKEMVIPNKAFITEQVINWTLSNPTLRLIVPVGVAYGSDIDEVERLLRQVAAQQEKVLEKPGSVVLFGGFGDSALNFELRVYLSHIEHLVPTRHALHRAITKEFARAGIEIAFPQRDLHLRSSEPLQVVVRGAEVEMREPGSDVERKV